MKADTNIISRTRRYFARKKGQATMELGLVIIVLVVVSFGIMEFGRMISLSIRMASVCREVGRTFFANEYDTNTIDDIFLVATNVIAPANLATGGKMIVTVIQRVDGDSTFLTTNSVPDVLVVTNQFFYPYGANPSVASSNTPTWPSKLVPTNYSTGSGSSKKLVPYPNNIGPVTLNMLPPNGRTAIVEVYHTNPISAPLNSVGMGMPVYLYDYAAF